MSRKQKDNLNGLLLKGHAVHSSGLMPVLIPGVPHDPSNLGHNVEATERKRHTIEWVHRMEYYVQMIAEGRIEVSRGVTHQAGCLLQRLADRKLC